MIIVAAVLATGLVLPVPFVHQKKDTCGAASLGMVLAYWDRAVPQDEIVATVVGDELPLHGIPGSRIADFARDRGMRAVAYEGDLAQLRDFVDKGRPLIVAWKVGKDRYHDVVVTGFDDEHADVFVNDPARGEHRRISQDKFEEWWAGARHWTLLVLPEAETYEEPPRLFAATTSASTSAPAESYDALVALGISLGKQGKNAEAANAFDRAIALDSARPEAMVERGGLRFLERRYDDAARDLEGALAVRDDGYARNMLASSYQLAGRSEDALREWNELGQPRLGGVTFAGLKHIHTGVARRELTVHEGEMLDVSELRESELRLEQIGVFGRVVLRPVPREEGKADLEVAVKERYAFGDWAQFLGTAAYDLTQRKVRLRYYGPFGSGITLGGAYRWEKARPQKSAFIDWPRFLWIPAYFHFAGVRETQPFDVGGPNTMKADGLEVGVRRVVGPKTVAQLGYRYRDREFSELQPDTPPGTIQGLSLGLEHQFWRSYRRRLDGSITGFNAGGVLHSDISYPQVVTSLRYEDILSRPDGTTIEKSVIAARILGGWAGDDMPLDEMFNPGGESVMAYPLRGHKLRDSGVIGQNPMGRTLGLFNMEWRQRLLNARLFQLGTVLFYDAAHIKRTAQGHDQTLEDLGVGVRIGIRGAVLRVDYGFSISGDGRHAFTGGYHQAF